VCIIGEKKVGVGKEEVGVEHEESRGDGLEKRSKGMSEEKIPVSELAKKIEEELREEWPGVKLGWESVLMHKSKESDTRWASTWKGALWLDAYELKKWASWCMAVVGDGLMCKFPESLDDVKRLPSFLGKPAEEVFKLGEAQAMCAAMWLMQQSYEMYDKKVGETKLDWPERWRSEHALRLPMEGKSEEGYCLRAAFSSVGVEAWGDGGDWVRAAYVKTLAAAENAGCNVGVSAREEEFGDDARKCIRVHGARSKYEVELLESFNEMLGQIELQKQCEERDVELGKKTVLRV